MVVDEIENSPIELQDKFEALHLIFNKEE